MRNHRNYTAQEIIREADFIIQNQSSTYSIEGVTQSTVWGHMNQRLPYLDNERFLKIRKILETNCRRRRRGS